MNAQSNNSSSNLIDLINNQVAIATLKQKQQDEVMEAAKLARAAKETATKHNAMRREAADQLVSEIQKSLASELKDIEAEAQKTYKQEMVRLGLDVEKFPLQTTLNFIDTKGITPVLETVGTATRKVKEFGSGIASRFLKGFNVSK